MRAFDAKDDLCVGFWAEIFTAHPDLLPLPEGAHVLEVGSADTDWLAEMHAVRPDLSLTGIDPRAVPMLKPGLRRIQANILTHQFTPGSFDAAVAVSTIEHIGCPMYADPELEDGDTRAMLRLGDLVRTGGWCYLDVPYREQGAFMVKKQNFRIYTPGTLGPRLIVGPWRERFRQVCGEGLHIDGPYLALILERV